MSTPLSREQFGMRLRNARNAAGYKKQSDLADEVGITLQTISNYEKGDRLPDAYTLSKLAHALRCTSDYLLFLEDAPTHDVADVVSMTGLSKDAAEVLCKRHRWGTRANVYADFITMLLCDVNTESLMQSVAEYLELTKTMQKRRRERWDMSAACTQEEAAAAFDDELQRCKERTEAQGIFGLTEERQFDLFLNAVKREVMEVFGVVFECGCWDLVDREDTDNGKH